jgi:hypothetical protein
MASDRSGRAIQGFAYIVVALFALNVMVPVAQAGGKSGKIVTQDQLVVLNAPSDLNWTALQNIANGTDYKYLDYNLTWLPFFQNNTDLTGVLVHNLFPPATWETNLTDNNLSVGSFFRILPQDIISGASEMWFRLPVADIPSTATISMSVYRVADPVIFNMSFDGFSDPDFYVGQSIQLVYDITLDPSAINITTRNNAPQNAWVDYKRWQNISVVGANDTLYYNFTYLKACFGLFPNEYYFVEFDITTLTHSPMKLLLSSGDFGSDDRNNTWFWMNGDDYYLPIDLDTSFVCTVGMSNGITGLGVRYDKRETSTPTGYAWHMYEDPMYIVNASIPINRFINAGAGFVYFNLAVPFFLNLSKTDQIELWVNVIYCQFEDSDVGFHHTWIFTPTNYYHDSAYNFFIATENLTAYTGNYIHHIRLEMKFMNNVTMTGTPHGDAVKFWGTRQMVNDVYGGFSDIYFRGFDNVSKEWKWTMAEKDWFIPFGYYSLDAKWWETTEMPIITVPANNPITPSKIDEVIQKFKLTVIRNQTSTYGGDVILSKEFWGTVGNGLSSLWDMEKALWGEFAKGAWWFLEHTSLALLLSQWYWLYKYAEKEAKAHNITVLDLMGLLWNKLKAIGQWVWHMIQLVFDALEWFTYWAVREIYAFSIAIVYIVNVFGVISINSALLAVARTGNGKDFVKAFRAGWRFVFAIISLLLSLAIMAISIVGAVVPF